MKSIIGLFNQEEGISAAVEQLRKAGVTDESIRLISDPISVNKLFGCDPAYVIKNYTVGGAAIGIGIYAIFGLMAANCQCTFLHYGTEYAIGAFVGAVLAGMFVGGVIGVMDGIGKAEQDTHLYVQGIRTGGKVISIRVLDEDAERVKHILVMENALGVRAFLPEGG